jgi:O-antigen ligase
MTTVPALLERHEVRSIARKKNVYPVMYVVFLCGVLMFGVLAFGAVETWSTSILEISSALLFTVVLVHQMCRSGRTTTWNPLYWPTLGFAALITAQLLFNLTAYRYATLVVFMEYVAYGMLFFVATQIAVDERASKLIVLGFCIFGSAVALFAICQNLSSSPNIYWLRPPNTDASIFGPYINHDHYAGLMEMLMPLALVLSLSSLLQGGQRILAAFGAVVMAGSIILSLSRGGAISAVAEVLALLWITHKSPGLELTRIRVLLIVVAVISFLGLIGSPVMWRHLGHLQDALRLDILKDSLRMFTEKPIIGWGLGTFPTVYPAFRSFYTTFFINAAHNDYAQALVETGAVGFLCIVSFITVLYRQGLKQTDDWTHRWRGTLRVAALTGCTGLLVHSAFDFNLQVPANAALFYAFCAIATTFPVGLSRESPTRVSLSRRRRIGEVESRDWRASQNPA